MNGDTVIMKALRGIVEDGTMDPQDFKDWLNRIESALMRQGEAQGRQGERIAKVEEKASAAHRRLDEAVRTLKGPGKPAWVGIILAVIAAMSAVGVAWVSSRTADKASDKVDAMQKP